ncbi:MAG: hypothetical protein ACREL3_04655 [Gemmatimonadales bacterium]
MRHTLECPACWTEIPLDGQMVICPRCRYQWDVQPDADCENGVWQDCTSLELPRDASREQIALVIAMRLAWQMQGNAPPIALSWSVASLVTRLGQMTVAA